MANTSKKRRLCDDAPKNINLQQFLLRCNNLQQRPKKTKLTSENYEINIQKLNGNGPLVSKNTRCHEGKHHWYMPQMEKVLRIPKQAILADSYSKMQQRDYYNVPPVYL